MPVMDQGLLLKLQAKTRDHLPHDKASAASYELAIICLATPNCAEGLTSHEHGQVHAGHSKDEVEEGVVVRDRRELVRRLLCALCLVSGARRPAHAHLSVHPCRCSLLLHCHAWNMRVRWQLYTQVMQKAEIFWHQHHSASTLNQNLVVSSHWLPKG